MQGPLKGPSKQFFLHIFLMTLFFLLNLMIFGLKTLFFELSLQSHAESSRNLIKNSMFDHLFFQVTHCSQNSSFLTSRQRFLIKEKTMFFKFLAEIRLRTPLKSPQKLSSRLISCNFHPTCTLPGRVRTLP